MFQGIARLSPDYVLPTETEINTSNNYNWAVFRTLSYLQENLISVLRYAVRQGIKSQPEIETRVHRYSKNETIKK